MCIKPEFRSEFSKDTIPKLFGVFLYKHPLQIHSTLKYQEVWRLDEAEDPSASAHFRSQSICPLEGQFWGSIGQVSLTQSKGRFRGRGHLSSTPFPKPGQPCGTQAVPGQRFGSLCTLLPTISGSWVFFFHYFRCLLSLVTIIPRLYLLFWTLPLLSAFSP